MFLAWLARLDSRPNVFAPCERLTLLNQELRVFAPAANHIFLMAQQTQTHPSIVNLDISDRPSALLFLYSHMVAVCK